MRRTSQLDGSLDGQLLIAMPGMTDKRFARSVIYLCAHSADGAMGIVINKLAAEVSFRDLLAQLGIATLAGDAGVPRGLEEIRVHVGGPVESGRGFVLHSADFFLEDSTLPIADSICLTATLDILRAVANGEGPRQAMLALGYAGWAPGQLEAEIGANGWLHCAADAALLFNADVEAKYDQAMAKLGVQPAMLSMEAGHA